MHVLLPDPQQIRWQNLNKSVRKLEWKRVTVSRLSIDVIIHVKISLNKMYLLVEPMWMIIITTSFIQDSTDLISKR